MKKILSIVCVLAMMLSLAVTVNAAADNEIFIAVESQTDSELVISLNSNSTVTIATISAYVDFADAVAKGAVYKSVEDINGNATPKYVANQKMFQIAYAPTSGARLTGANKLATVTFDISAVTEAFTVGRKANAGRAVFKIGGVDDGGSIYDATSAFTWDSTLNISKAPAFVAETVKGAVVEGDDADIELDKTPATAYKNVYTNVATFAATLGADVNYSEAGFIWVKDDVETANKFVATDDEAVSGEGTFEYAVVMVGIPTGTDIDAIPYYVTAE